MSAAAAHQRDWEELARVDPLWAIQNNPGTRYGNWDLEEFFATGEEEVAATMARLDELGVPSARSAALDFGCGVGRASRALASRFDRVTGLDISPTMLEQGREHNREIVNLEFVQNTAEDLTVLGEQRFDLVYTRWVLQHVPNSAAVRAWVNELVRVAAPGGCVVLALPTHIPLRYRLLIVRRLYVALHALGIPPRVLYERLKLYPIRMLAVDEATMRGWLAEAGAEVLAVDTFVHANGVVNGTFVASPSAAAA